MTYSRPEVVVLGKASDVVQQLGKPYGAMWDGVQFNFHPAYDLDE